MDVEEFLYTKLIDTYRLVDSDYEVNFAHKQEQSLVFDLIKSIEFIRFGDFDNDLEIMSISHIS